MSVFCYDKRNINTVNMQKFFVTHIFCFFFSYHKGYKDVLIAFLLFFPLSAWAFVGEDLGIDLYKNIDENFENLETQQYEYELTGQWETDIHEVVNQILEKQWVSCEISSPQDIIDMSWVWNNSSLKLITEKCVKDGIPIPNVYLENTQNAFRYIMQTYGQRAKDKSKDIYDIGSIGLYNDGSIENAPFDLIADIVEIDTIIFSQELEYDGVEYDFSDDAVQDFVDKNFNDPIVDAIIDIDVEDDENDDDTWEDSTDEKTDTDTDDVTSTSLPIGHHNYVCPVDKSWLENNDLAHVVDDLSPSWSTQTGSTSWETSTNYWVYPVGEVSNGASWGGPFPWGTPWGSYDAVVDSWPCEDIFCIIIEFQETTYGLAWGTSFAIETIVKKVEEHLQKTSNTSLTQRKMTSDNFELGSIIDNLPDMLRGFGIEVQSKPVPILELENENKDLVEWDIYAVQNQLFEYHRNMWLNYEKRNNLDIFYSKAEEMKVLQTSWGQSIVYPEKRMNELEGFKKALKKNNEKFTYAIDAKISQDSLGNFGKQFAELEIFVAGIEDFCRTITNMIWEMWKIPTRSS